MPASIRRPAKVALYGDSVDIGTLRKITAISVNTFGCSALIDPSTLTDPNSSTCPSSFTVARPFGSEPSPATAPLSVWMRVAKGSTRLRSAKFIELLSSRTRPMRTGNAGLGSRPVVVVGSALGVGGAGAVFCAVAPGFMSFARFKVLS